MFKPCHLGVPTLFTLIAGHKTHVLRYDETSWHKVGKPQWSGSDSKTLETMWFPWMAKLTAPEYTDREGALSVERRAASVELRVGLSVSRY